MRPFIPCLLILLTINVLSAQKDYPRFTLAQREAHLMRLADSSSWDWTMLNRDVEAVNFFADAEPMLPGVFPVPPYDLVGEGSFDGIFDAGTLWNPDTIAGKTIVYHAFGIGNNAWNRPYMGPDKDQVYFTLITVVDTLDEDGYAIHNGMVSSRNNPDVIGEGSIRNTISRIDYIAFMTAENDRFAIINMRLFDLSHGDVIVIAPQRDGSFRALQIKNEPRSEARNDTFIREDVLRREGVQMFLSEAEVIGGGS